MEVQKGDRIQINEWKTLWHSFRTKQWMANEIGTVLNVNNKTITVRFDNYPDEKHYIDYGDYTIIKDPEKERKLEQKILKGVLLLRRCGNKYSSKETQIAEQKKWLESGYYSEEDLDKMILDLKEELAKTPEQKELESKEYIEWLMKKELQETQRDDVHRTISSTAGDYGPSNPWDAPGMSVRDFI